LEERDAYIRSGLLRFRETLAFLPPASPGERLLELGGAPYLFSLLLERYTGYVIEVADEPLPGRPRSGEVTRVDQRSNEVHSFEAKTFNVETDEFPYDSESFDIVLCCELLEHLVLDPTHMLTEIHRVLKPGGRLLLTTPNVLVWRHVAALSWRRKNIYGPYSGYGVYGRHNREWTEGEVRQLLHGCGFRVERSEVRDTYRHRLHVRVLKYLVSSLRDVIFVLARADGDPVEYYPDNLYVARFMRQGAGFADANREAAGRGQ